MSGDPWADDYDFPEDEKYVRWGEGKFYRTHDKAYRYRAWIDVRDPSRNWNGVGMSRWRLQRRAAAAERRTGVRIRWLVLLPPSRRDVRSLPAPALNDTIPVEVPRDVD